MSTATLAHPVAVQMTFPWETPDTGSSLRRTSSPTVPAPRQETKRPAFTAVVAEPVTPVASSALDSSLINAAVAAPVVSSVAESLEGDRLCRPMRIGSVMFRLLKSYGITDEEIADGIAAYTAKAK